MLGLSESGTTEQSDFDKDEEVEDNDKEEDEQQAPICSLLVPASSKPGKIEMYSPAFYAACTAGGILSCDLLSVGSCIEQAQQDRDVLAGLLCRLYRRWYSQLWSHSHVSLLSSAMSHSM
nr:mitochondrial phosphate carrier protein 3, mitochondrial [Quercus suber]